MPNHPRALAHDTHNVLETETLVLDHERAMAHEIRNGLDTEHWCSLGIGVELCVCVAAGADSLGGDKLGDFNLSIRQHAEAVDFMKKFGLPMLVTGGESTFPALAFKTIADLRCVHFDQIRLLFGGTTWVLGCCLELLDIIARRPLSLQCIGGACSASCEVLMCMIMLLSSGHMSSVVLHRVHKCKLQRPTMPSFDMHNVNAQMPYWYAGGGYKKRNVARCWTYETAVLVGKTDLITDQLPNNKYLDNFRNEKEDITRVPTASADKMNVDRRGSRGDSLNKPAQLERIKLKALQYMSKLEAAPGEA